MEVVLVERSFDAPADVPALQAQEDNVAWCLSQYDVTFTQSFCAHDRRRLLCQYQAPDAEAVRRTQDEARLPYERIWTSAPIRHRPAAVPDGAQLVVIERELSIPLTRPLVQMSFESAAAVLAEHGIIFITSYLSVDGRRMTCHALSKSVEAAKTANRQGQLSFKRIWSAELLRPATK